MRTFQLLVQVAGRAGRGDVPGQVVVQSYTPHHAVLHRALTHDFAGFAADEMATRQALNFPPYSHVVMIHVRGPEEMKVAEAAAAFAERLRPLLEPGAEVVGPMPAPIPKIRGRFRYQFMVRGGSIVRFTQRLRPVLMATGNMGDIDIAVDVDPYDLM